jgi:hypothetical protein
MEAQEPRLLYPALQLPMLVAVAVEFLQEGLLELVDLVAVGMVQLPLEPVLVERLTQEVAVVEVGYQILLA